MSKNNKEKCCFRSSNMKKFEWCGLLLASAVLFTHKLHGATGATADRVGKASEPTGSWGQHFMGTYGAYLPPLLGIISIIFGILKSLYDKSVKPFFFFGIAGLSIILIF